MFKSTKVKIFISIIIAIFSVIIGVGMGSVYISPLDVIKVLLNKILFIDLGSDFNEIYISLVWNVRLPRVIISFIVGGMLSVSGAVIQSVLQNPLASSYSLGVSAGSGVGAALIIITGLGVGAMANLVLLPIASLCFGMATVFTVIFIASKIDKSMSNNTVVLLGMIVSLFMNAILSNIAVMFPKHTERITLWQTGSFSMKDWSPIYILLPTLIVLTLIFMKNTTEMDIMTFGDEQALTVGVDVKRKKFILIGLSAVMSGVAVSFTGIIGFVDLVIAHVVRRIFGASHRYVIPISMLYGGSFIVFCDLISRTIASPREVPVGSVTAMIGAPFFVYIFVVNRKKG